MNKKVLTPKEGLMVETKMEVLWTLGSKWDSDTIVTKMTKNQKTSLVGLWNTGAFSREEFKSILKPFIAKK